MRAALRALPIYAMSALLLPAGTLLEIDKRCRAFFWSGQDSITGRQCKVAWDLVSVVCAPFANGGLGFSSLKHMNVSLLLKHLSKLHDAGIPTESSYLVTKYGWSESHDLGSAQSSATTVWKDILKGLSFFRSITSVTIGNAPPPCSGLIFGYPTLPLLWPNNSLLYTPTLPPCSGLPWWPEFLPPPI